MLQSLYITHQGKHSVRYLYGSRSKAHPFACKNWSVILLSLTMMKVAGFSDCLNGWADYANSFAIKGSMRKTTLHLTMSLPSHSMLLVEQERKLLLDWLMCLALFCILEGWLNHFQIVNVVFCVQTRKQVCVVWCCFCSDRHFILAMQTNQ